MDLDGVDVDFLTEDEILNIYNEVLESPDDSLIAAYYRYLYQYDVQQYVQYVTSCRCDGYAYFLCKYINYTYYATSYTGFSNVINCK